MIPHNVDANCLMMPGTERDNDSVKSDLFPETRSAWARMKFSLRSIISIKLFAWAMHAAPEEEQVSVAIALHEHIQRTNSLHGNKRQNP